VATETELKFIAPSRTLGTALRLSWVKDLMIEKPRSRKLVSTYFDTADFALAKRKMSLRIRRTGKSYVQTVKASRPKGQGIERDEWERNVPGNHLDLNGIEDKKLRKFLNAEGINALRPLFQTRIARTSVPLRAGPSILELAIDRGIIQASRRRAQIHEIELELKHGKKDDLFRLGRRLARDVGAA
jgi:inorganic triphosphatase YgiF